MNTLIEKYLFGKFWTILSVYLGILSLIIVLIIGFPNQDNIWEKMLTAQIFITGIGFVIFGIYEIRMCFTEMLIPAPSMMIAGGICTIIIGFAGIYGSHSIARNIESFAPKILPGITDIIVHIFTG